MRFSSRLFVSLAVFVGLAAALPSVSRAATGEVTLTRVFTGWRDAASFKRISEYFSGKENTGGVTVLRTHPEQRTGFYFLARASNPGAPVAVKINIELIAPNDHKPRNYTFSTDLKTGDTVLNLGLTAGDWPDATANPIAWKIDLVGPDGKTLAGEKSYLWEKPLVK